MKLKCIGGRCDGISVDIPDHARYREGDSIRVPDYPTSINEVDFSFNPSSKVVVDNFIYVIDVFRMTTPGGGNAGFNKSEIWFLRPQNLTTFDAIQFQFMK